MYSDFDNAIAYEWQDIDDYPHRSQKPDTIERTIAYGAQACGVTISVADTRFAVSPLVLVATMERLRRICNAIPTPPAGYATCCECGKWTPNSSGTCQHCGGIYTPF